METQKLISIATEAGYEVVEYPGFYCVILKSSKTL